MHTYIIEMLECPSCHSRLEWDISEQQGDRIETAKAHCRSCTATYPVREGIGAFLTPELTRDDLWEQTDSSLAQYLRQHPETERQLMDVPLEALGPADQFFRALILDERGDFAQAKVAADTARAELYSPEYLACADQQMSFALRWLATAEGPLVDLASGLGHLVEAMARQLSQPIIATDFSPRVLKRLQRRLKFFDLYSRVSLLAFDARRTPFKNCAVSTLTTYQGLANIRQPGDLLRELRRIVGGSFLALTLFFPEEDEVNASAIRKLGLGELLFRRLALESFAGAGWQVEVAHSCSGKARPTPTGAVLQGAGIDALPVTETALEWCALIARWQ